MLPSTKAKQRVVIDDIMLRLGQIMKDLGAVRAQMHNRSQKRSRLVGEPITRDLARIIRAMHRQDPERPFQDIAQACNVSIGRVSELIRGKRT